MNKTNTKSLCQNSRKDWQNTYFHNIIVNNGNSCNNNNNNFGGSNSNINGSICVSSVISSIGNFQDLSDLF